MADEKHLDLSREAPASSAPAGEPRYVESTAPPDWIRDEPRMSAWTNGYEAGQKDAQASSAPAGEPMTDETLLAPAQIDAMMAELDKRWPGYREEARTQRKRITELEAFQTAVTVAIGAGHGGAAYADVPQRIRALYAERDALKEHVGDEDFRERDRLRAQVETLTAELNTVKAELAKSRE